MIASWLQRIPTHTAPLGAGDAERMAEIHGASFARGWSALDFERLLAERGAVGDGLFAERGGALRGFVVSRRVLDEAEILTVALDPDIRGRGCARPLLQRHLGVLARLGTRRVHLEVEDGNGPALALYRRLGFRETGRRVGYYAKPGGARATALAMSLDL